VVLGVWFIAYGFRCGATTATRWRASTFRFSIWHLSLLFARCWSTTT
jgi:heme O synthase-like polyprenyltransferase